MKLNIYVYVDLYIDTQTHRVHQNQSLFPEAQSSTTKPCIHPEISCTAVLEGWRAESFSLLTNSSYREGSEGSGGGLQPYSEQRERRIICGMYPTLPICLFTDIMCFKGWRWLRGSEWELFLQRNQVLLPVLLSVIFQSPAILALGESNTCLWSHKHCTHVVHIHMPRHTQTHVKEKVMCLFLKRKYRTQNVET